MVGVVKVPALPKWRHFVPESLPHLRTIMAYPSAASLPEAFLPSAREEITVIARKISRFEPVTLLSRKESIPFLQSHFQATEQGLSRVTIREMEVENCWVRDTGPVFVRSGDKISGREQKERRIKGDLYGVDFNFDDWGKKLPLPGNHDHALATNLLDYLNVPRLSSDLRLEGGALETDGADTLLVTRSSVSSQKRNPRLDIKEIEERLKAALGAQKIISIPGVVGQDVTDCHIDALARFAYDHIRPANANSPSQVVVLVSQPHRSRMGMGWMKAYQDTLRILREQHTLEKKRILTVSVPEPDITKFAIRDDYRHAVLSYVNFAWVNGGLVVPAFGDKEADEVAMEIFREFFPGREIAQVKIKTLPLMGGGIHCVTLQVPADGTDYIR